MSDKQIARLVEDNLKNELAAEETISQSEPILQDEVSHQYEASAAPPAAEHQQPELSEPSRKSTRNRKQPDRFREPIPTNFNRNLILTANDFQLMS